MGAATEAAKVWCVVPAAGSGRRLGAAIPKQYLDLCGRRVIEHTLERLLALAPAGIVVANASSVPIWRSVKRSLCVSNP